ncbi:ATP-binding protein [Halorubrum salsamenti]|uniref:ATP-binding protein n=1 Tax=Halorubrum salsamenti TaxID=2583990 RepID=UPI00119CD9AC|nr:ATP-binding protein [Halorubrum salsamenti]
MNASPDESDEIRVLHVDDEPEWYGLSQGMLESIDDRITVIGEQNSGAALDYLSSDSIDCVISDYRMPEPHGIELLQRVRENYPNLPFILFTGEGSEEIASEATTAGANAYVKKGGPEVFQLLATQVKQSVAHRRSERRARVANDRLLAFYEQTDGLYILSHDWTILYWNEEMTVRTGYDSEEVLGTQFREVFPRGTQTDLHDTLRKAMTDRESVECDLYYEPHDYWVEIRAYPVDEGLVVHSRDISEEKQHEEQLTRRNQILESFANTVSHDFRNPLSVAEGHLQLAQETGDFSHLDQVATAHNRMRNLIDDLLQLAREEERDQSMVSLHESATRVWETVDGGDAQLAVRDDAEFAAYSSQLRRIFENLYWNALDHGDATSIRVGTLGEAGFYVEDDGSGIPASDRDLIFEAGYSTSENGTGYGLHIVKSLVEMHDWTISVTESEDGGTRFEISGVTFTECDA